MEKENQITITEKIEALAKLGSSVRIGRYLGIISKGWLWIDDQGDYYNISLADSKTSHNRLLSGPLIGADFLKATGERKIEPGFRGIGAMSGAWKQAISMWPVNENVEAEKIFNTVKSCVDQAYEYNCR